MPKFSPPRWIEAEYQTSISKLMASILPKPEGDFDAWLKRLGDLSQRLDILDMGAKLAHRMATQVNIQSAKSWREAAAKSQRSQMLYRLLQREMSGSVGARVAALTQQNARLISSIPLNVSQKLTQEIMRAQQAGARPETLAKLMVNRFPELAGSRIRLIARTETSKASTALTEARAEDLGLGWLEWKTSHDQRVRFSHRNLDSVLMNWNDLPSPEALVGEKSMLGRYGPGSSPNCRCYPAPLLSLDDISWPHRCYHAGQITRMTRTQFQLLSGMATRRAA